MFSKIYRTLEISQVDSGVFVLTPAMHFALDEGLEDVKNGRVIINAEENIEIDEWLSKYIYHPPSGKLIIASFAPLETNPLKNSSQPLQLRSYR